MTNDKDKLKPKITFKPDGSYKVEGLERLEDSDGNLIPTKSPFSLCRCGGSSRKPFCDGTHRSNGFSGAKLTDGKLDKRDNYIGPAITIHDNRGICSHAAKCTDNLSTVWSLNTEPWIDPDGASTEEIINTVKLCPSGALSFTIDKVEHRDQEREPAIRVTKDGPFYVTGGVLLENQPRTDSVSTEHYALCRCGRSKNKPFCDGTHWHIGFSDDGRENKVAGISS